LLLETIIQNWTLEITRLSTIVLKLLYDSPGNVPIIKTLTVDLKGMDDGMIAYTRNDMPGEYVMELNASYFATFNGDKLKELKGVMIHEMVHVYQMGINLDMGLREGIADYIRLKSEFIPEHWTRNNVENTWNAGYESTAFFLEFVEKHTRKPSFVKDMNFYFKEREWNYNKDQPHDDVFFVLTGISLEDLWLIYKLSNETDPITSWPDITVELIVKDPADDIVSLIGNWVEEVSKISSEVVLALYERPSEVPGVIQVKIIIRKMDGVAHTIGDYARKEIHLSIQYFRSFKGDKYRELRGVITHELVHVWQYNALDTMDGGLVEGIADYVRLKSGYIPSHWNPKHPGTEWNAGYQATAYFLVFIENHVGPPKFVKDLNFYFVNRKWKKSAKVFFNLTGIKLDDLWAMYLASGN
jgi:uncharacterized membrane protein